jgi:hypothetical protein
MDRLGQDVLNTDQRIVTCQEGEDICLDNMSHETQSSKDHSNSQQEAFSKEIRQVQQKIRNLKESIQLSTNIAQPLVWQANGLNAALNIVNQWKTIVVFYSSKNQVDERIVIHEDSLDRSKETSLQVYGIIQMVMQTGPLKSCHPGYFKRCGGQVAKMAKEFLVKCIQGTSSDGEGETMESVDNSNTCSNNIHVLIPETNKTVVGQDSCYVVADELRFTSQQKSTLLKWIKDADKAIAANKPPSKSAIKLQTSINTKGMSRRDKRRKGQLVKHIV